MFVKRCKDKEFFINFAFNKDYLRLMKHYFIYILSVLSAFFVMSCGEDRTYEYEEKTQHNQWAYELMQEHYLWNETIKEPEWKNFFKTPSEFLTQLTNKSGHNDSWSYVTVDTVASDPHQRGYFNHVNSYGYDFMIMTDPTQQTTKTYARVLTVYPNSPAEKAGLKRNDFIAFFDGYKVTTGNASKLSKGIARTYDVCHIAENEEEGVLYWKDTVKVQIGQSEYVEDKAFPVYNTQEIMGITVGYLQCTRLIDYPEEQGVGRVPGDKTYQNELDKIMKEMRSKGVSEFVLDLRLCNYGNIEMARRLASYVVDPNYIDDVFAKTIWNENYQENNVTYNYDASLIDTNLHLGRIYILTSNYTQGAAEWVINALKNSMGDENVIVVGNYTAGQMVMTQNIGSKYNVTLYPVVAYVTSSGVDYDQFTSIFPDETVIENNYIDLGTYGSINEPLMNKAVRMMMGLESGE